MPHDLADTMTEVAERSGACADLNLTRDHLAVLRRPANQRFIPYSTLSNLSVWIVEDLYDPVREILESHGACDQLGRRIIIGSIPILKHPAPQMSTRA